MPEVFEDAALFFSWYFQIRKRRRGTQAKQAFGLMIQGLPFLSFD
jgi:hypothetical protein